MSSVAAASIIGGVVSGVGSVVAGGEQARAAKSAAQLQAEEQDKALAFQRDVWNTQQKEEAPYLAAGGGAISTLSRLLSTPGEGLLTPWTGEFKAPTAAEAEATPGFQFQLNEGIKGLDLSAAARGNLLTGGTLKGIEQFGQGLASTNYQNVFENAMRQYQSAFQTFETNQANSYSRLAGLAQGGQQAVQALGGEGSRAASNISNTYLTGGAQIGQDIMGAGAATASGYAGLTNAIGGGIQNLGSIALLQQILNRGPQPSGFDYGSAWLNPTIPGSVPTVAPQEPDLGQLGIPGVNS